MSIATIFQHYLPIFKKQHGHRTTSDQWSALNAILGCRTGPYGEIQLSCNACPYQDSRYQSCGHRSCNQCQHHSTTLWLERQKTKLLPVEYFMVTCTLPAQLRSLAKSHQKIVYDLLFKCTSSLIKEFGRNDKRLAAELAMTSVLHTHTRQLDYHPHLHIIVPGGVVNAQRNEWRKLKGNYLFNGRKFAKAFRGRMLSMLADAGLKLPATPKKWVVQCQRVGRGLPALQYLSRYLYRGVIQDRNILDDDGTYVTFQYKDSTTGKLEKRRIRGENFMALLLQHTLPKGFRRARDYGFLHGNTKRVLKVVQLILYVVLPPPESHPRPTFKCKKCGCPMVIARFVRPRSAVG